MNRRCARGDADEARSLAAEHSGLLEGMGPEERGTLARAAMEGRAGAVRLMVELGFDLGWEDREGGTALHHAAWRGNVAMTRLLLELGAPVNVRDRPYGCSPLAWAAHGSHHGRASGRDHEAVVNALLDAGSDRATAINLWGASPESVASREVAKILRERGFAPPS